MIHRLSCDFFNQELFLIPGVELDIEITPNNNNFMIIQKAKATGDPDKNFHIDLVNLYLLVKTGKFIDLNIIF